MPREKIQLATKFGIVGFDQTGGFVVSGRPEYVRACCEASLERLGVEYIDLYYQHRVDKTVPIEDTVNTDPLDSSHCSSELISVNFFVSMELTFVLVFDRWGS